MTENSPPTEKSKAPPLAEQAPGVSKFAELDRRGREVFQHVIATYLDTGEPAGSQGISQRLSEPLSPATVRKVMADLEALDLIHSPHTSAGRLPTEIGIRFFVDSLLEVSALESEKKQAIDRYSAGRQNDGLNELLSGLSGLISNISQSACVVTTDKQSHPIKQVEFVRLEPTKVMVILVSRDGTVENRMIDVGPELPESSLREAANWINHHAYGLTIEEARRAISVSMKAEQERLDTLVEGLIKAGVATWGGADLGRQLIVRGQANLFAKASMAENLEKARLLLNELESKEAIASLLGEVDHGDGVRIFIGSESKLYSLSDSSVIAAPFRNDNQEIIGAIGVIGPTRLNYASVIPMVDYTAQVVSEYLAKRS